MARTKRSKAVLSDSTNTSTTKKSRVSSWHHEENSIWDKLQVVLEKKIKAVNDAKKNDTIHYSIDPEVEKLCEEIRQSLLELKADPKQEWTPLSKKDRAKLNKLKQVFDDMVEEMRAANRIGPRPMAAMSKAAATVPKAIEVTAA